MNNGQTPLKRNKHSRIVEVLLEAAGYITAARAAMNSYA